MYKTNRHGRYDTYRFLRTWLRFLITYFQAILPSRHFIIVIVGSDNLFTLDADGQRQNVGWHRNCEGCE